MESAKPHNVDRAKWSKKEPSFIWRTLDLVPVEDEEEMKTLFVCAFLKMYRVSGVFEDRSNEAIRDFLANEDFERAIRPAMREDKTQLYLTVKLDDELIGYALFQHLDQDITYLVEIAVAPEYWRMGLGARMVFSILDKWPWTRKIVLLTELTNQLAHRFYSSLNFTRSNFTKEGFPSTRFCAYEIETFYPKKDL